MDRYLQDATQADLKSDIPEFRPGDRISVDVKVIEGTRSRLQTFEGNVIAISGSGINKTFTVRKIAEGIGVERIFPMHSPSIAAIRMVRRGKVRRAKLYYLRELKGKAARIKERR